MKESLIEKARSVSKPANMSISDEQIDLCIAVLKGEVKAISALKVLLKKTTGSGSVFWPMAIEAYRRGRLAEVKK